MDEGVFELSYYQVALGFVFVLFVLFILRRRGIKRDRLVLLASVRMTVQLILMGFLLTFIFDNPHPLITLMMLVVMTSFAVLTVFRKFRDDLTPSLKRVIMFSLPVGGVASLFYFLFVVVQIDPYYNPRYVIPITGMIVGNSMTGIGLGIQTLIRGFNDQKAEVEESLILGASPKEASHDIVNRAFDSAILPTLNNMLGMGIIFLPGMMSGQILSGVDPNLAIMYQIGVMLGILGGVSLSTYLFLRFGYKTFFNKEAQLINNGKA